MKTVTVYYMQTQNQGQF